MISLREAMNAGGDMVADIARKTYTAPARKLRREIRIRKNPYMDAVMLRVYGGRGVSLMNYHPDPSSPDKHPPPRSHCAGQARRIKASLEEQRWRLQEFYRPQKQWRGWGFCQSRYQEGKDCSRQT